MRPAKSLLFLVPALLGFLGCAKPRTQVVLMPDADGHVGAVEVRNAMGSQVLDQARQGVQVSQRGPGTPEVLPDAQIQARFGPAIAAQPKAPAHFLLEFETGSVSLTAASSPVLAKILEAVRERTSVDISVVGHTDTAGSAEVNNLLARQRAEAVAKLLTNAGVDPRNLEITSHGKAVPLVPTGDNVSEPRNRRVEVTVR